jgi:hypothetical protein
MADLSKAEGMEDDSVAWVQGLSDCRNEATSRIESCCGAANEVVLRISTGSAA